MSAPDTRLADLEALLEEEREALLAGDLDSVALLLPRKEALVAALVEGEPPDPQPVEAMRSKLRHNQMLLEGAMEGIRSVAARLKALQQVREALETYDANGRKQSIRRGAVGTVERRA